MILSRFAAKLAQEAYALPAPLVQKVQQRAQSEIENKLLEGGFDQQEFLTYISDHKDFLESYLEVECRSRRTDPTSFLTTKHCFPRLKWRILRYEERIHRQLDWAVTRLLQRKETRKTLSHSEAGI
jgi:hypothetical protein